jgi:hypothetical protein
MSDPTDLQLQAAQAAGLRAEDAVRLRGDTADELAADAQAFAKAIGTASATSAPSSSSFDGGVRPHSVQLTPTTVEEARRLASENPARFNAMVDSGQIDLGGLA